jgi:hypothetical protein
MARTANTPRVERRQGAIYTEEELGAILHASEEVMRGLRQTGQIRFLRVGRKILYPDEYVQEYIDRAGVRESDQVADRLALVQRR